MSQSPRHVIAYFTEWSHGKPYTVKSMEQCGSARKLTIINYAFGIPEPDPQTGDVVCKIENRSAAYAQVYDSEASVDGQADDPTQPLRGHFNQLKKLKQMYPHLKVVVSLGGWTGSGWFSPASATPEARRRFVASCIDQFILGNLPLEDGAGGPGAGAGVFDGIDLDWEYPMGNGLETNHALPEDGANYVALCAEFRRQYEQIGRPDLLLTMAGAGPVSLAGQYHLRDAYPYFDLITIMTYDFRGIFTPVAGHHTNLCNSAMDPAPAAERNSTDTAVRAYRDTYEVPAEKIAVGAAFYGKAWEMPDGENNGLYRPGRFLERGGGNYHRLLEKMQEGFARHWDESASAPWLFHPQNNIFISYDDPQSVALKAEYVRHYGLGGVMFWEISGDDAQGSLVDAIYRGLHADTPSADPCAGTR